tara:strand:+ start:3716 stop:4726 length:1011 start_codon:yes stop_codon:yes gene_type:complete
VKIVFFGTPKYAAENLEHLIKTGYDVIAVVTQPDRKRSRGKKLTPSPVKQTAIDFEIPVYETHSISKDQYIKNLLIKLNADVYIVVAFGQILSKEILDQPTLGCWNSHASLLPKWRGAAPIQWSIISDDEKTGICIMAMEEGLDTGPVIDQQSTNISDKDNLETLTNRLSEISSKLLVKSINRIYQTIGLNQNERLKRLNAIDQSKIKGNESYARQIKKEDYLINWNEKARIIIKKIQGLYPNAYTLHNGKRLKILEASLLEQKEIRKGNLILENNNINDINPGQIIMISQKDGIKIMTEDEPIKIEYGKLEGKNRADAYTLSIQSNLNIKDILGL